MPATALSVRAAETVMKPLLDEVRRKGYGQSFLESESEVDFFTVQSSLLVNHTATVSRVASMTDDERNALKNKMLESRILLGVDEVERDIAWRYLPKHMRAAVLIYFEEECLPYRLSSAIELARRSGYSVVLQADGA